MSIVQTTLGILLIVSAVLFSDLIMGGYWGTHGVDREGGIISSLGNPGRNISMDTWLWFYLSLGLAVLAAGIISFFIKGIKLKTWLACTQTILGGLVVISLVAYMVWVEPDWAPYTIVSESTGNLVVMRHDSTWVAQQITWKVSSILVGLGVAGLGLVQFRRYRKG